MIFLSSWSYTSRVWRSAAGGDDDNVYSRNVVYSKQQQHLVYTYIQVIYAVKPGLD